MAWWSEIGFGTLVAFLAPAYDHKFCKSGLEAANESKDIRNTNLQQRRVGHGNCSFVSLHLTSSLVAWWRSIAGWNHWNPTQMCSNVATKKICWSNHVQSDHSQDLSMVHVCSCASVSYPWLSCTTRSSPSAPLTAQYEAQSYNFEAQLLRVDPDMEVNMARSIIKGKYVWKMISMRSPLHLWCILLLLLIILLCRRIGQGA